MDFPLPPTNQLPSSTGVRIAGDNYQWLHVWRTCMEILHEQATRHTSNPGVSVGVEEPGVGNGDDVVLHRTHPPHTYTQAKYAVDARTPVSLTYLDDEKILLKMVKTHKALTANGAPIEMRLVTNRLVDPSDLLLKDRDGRDGRLVPRAAQGGAMSARGKARTSWVKAAETDEQSLLAFLEDFYLDVGYDVERLRKDVSLLMTANGLESDRVAVDLATAWVEQEVRAGHRRLSLADITQAIDDLNLRSGTPWTTVSIATLDHDPLAHQASASIDWVERMRGDRSWSKVEPEAPATWSQLATDIGQLRPQLNGDKRVLVTGTIRQATGFYIGCEFRRVLGYQVGIRQGDQLWTGDSATAAYAVTQSNVAVTAGADLALIVNAATTATDAVLDWIHAQHLPIANAIAITPTAGAGPTVLPSPEAANSLAVRIRDIARANRPHNGDIHLFLAGPLGLAVLLGHHWSRLATTHVYEHLGEPAYTHAFTIEA